MELEDFVKGLKVGEYVRLETADENCRVIEIWRNAEGKYGFSFNFLEHYGEFKTADELLNYILILSYYGGKWIEYDYEIYKTRAELKSEVKQLKKENAKLEKALKSACEIIEDGEICSECPATNSCLENSDITCAKIIFDCLMKEAAEE